MSTAITPTSIFLDPTLSTNAWKAAELFADSTLIPQHLRGKPGDCMIALALAHELGDSPLHVMQSIYVVSGKAGFSASYMIARANQSGVFRGRISWRSRGEGDSLAVQAFAVLADTGEEVNADTSMQMARDEGWTKNPKYRSMPKHMLRYRAATMLVRLYAPEVMHGFKTQAEIIDITAAEEAPRQVETLPTTRRSALPDPDARVHDIAPAPAREPVRTAPAPAAPAPAPAPQPAPDVEDLAAVKAECAELEEKVGPACAEAIRVTGKGPRPGDDVRAWKGRAANAIAYRDALRQEVADRESGGMPGF